MQTTDFEAMRACIYTLLRYPRDLKWSVQGFGMMRAYFGTDPRSPADSKRFRLNVWDSRLAVKDVSVVHDHPWSFKSWIINGEFHNVRYVEDFLNGDPYDFMIIKTGEGGGPDGIGGTIRLRTIEAEAYKTGDTYFQTPTEIHMSAPADSTVTLNDRTRVGDGEHARVFWPAGGVWVDAAPRAATLDEIYRITQGALDKWE